MREMGLIPLAWSVVLSCCCVDGYFLGGFTSSYRKGIDIQTHHPPPDTFVEQKACIHNLLDALLDALVPTSCLETKPFIHF